METNYRAAELEIRPDDILIISKQNAKTFHNQVKERIKETGEGLFEYLETIKFFEKLKEVISGNSQSKNPDEQEGDKEIKEMVRAEVVKFNGKFTTPRGVKFENAETGTKYDFTKCGDTELLLLETQMKIAETKLKERREFLKNVPDSGIDVVDVFTGEVVKVYPPSKTSNSSYKITLPK